MQQRVRWILVSAVVAAALAGATGSQGGARSCAPSLTILSPVAGETVRTPFVVRYRVTCVRIGKKMYLSARLGGSCCTKSRLWMCACATLEG